MGNGDAAAERDCVRRDPAGALDLLGRSRTDHSSRAAHGLDLYLARQQRARQDAAHFAFSSGIAAFANGTVAPHTKMDRAVGLPVWRATTPSTTNCDAQEDGKGKRIKWLVLQKLASPRCWALFGLGAMSALSPLSDAFRYRRGRKYLSPAYDDAPRLREPPSGNDFAAAVAEKLTEANSELWNASILWELVYNQGSDLRAN